MKKLNGWWKHIQTQFRREITVPTHTVDIDESTQGDCDRYRRKNASRLSSHSTYGKHQFCVNRKTRLTPVGEQLTTGNRNQLPLTLLEQGSSDFQQRLSPFKEKFAAQHRCQRSRISDQIKHPNELPECPVQVVEGVSEPIVVQCPGFSPSVSQLTCC